MNGADVQRYEYALEKVQKMGLSIEVIGDRISLYNIKNNEVYGLFDTVNDLFYFVCGFEWAKAEE